MREFEEAIANGLYNEEKLLSKNYVAIFYREQLRKFNQIGLGNETEYGVEVTNRLIEITEKRYQELKPVRSLRETKRKNKWQV